MAVDRCARRIAITGAGGFVGGFLVKELAGADVDLVAIGANGGPALDITDRAAVSALIAELQPDAIVHLAAVAFPADARRDPDHAWRVNVDGTLNIARAILAHSRQTRLVFAGSSEAYGAAFNAALDGRVDEQAALLPMSAYGASKAAADMALGQMAHDGLDVVRFRPFNHTGPGQSTAYVVPAFAQQVAAIKRADAEAAVRVGNLDAVRDFLDVRDVVRAYAMAATAETPLPAGSVFNLASGQPTTIADILDRLVAQAGRPVTIETDPARVRPSEVPRALGDPLAAQTVLGWAPRIPLARTIDDVLQHFLDA
jgi:GDP-4-dehydro-6-deoxy-D-mannose reductase